MNKFITRITTTGDTSEPIPSGSSVLQKKKKFKYQRQVIVVVVQNSLNLGFEVVKLMK